MDNIKQWLKFNISYFRKPPWDTRISPPELIDYINRNNPGMALDLGCGTGTNVITLANAGWDVKGIDFSFLAVLTARRRVKKAQQKVDIVFGDGTNLDLVRGRYDLVLDIGCFHGLTPEAKYTYIHNLAKLLKPGGTLLMYAHLQAVGDNPLRGLSEKDIEKIIRAVPLTERTDSLERKVRPATWMTFKNPE